MSAWGRYDGESDTYQARGVSSIVMDDSIEPQGYYRVTLSAAMPNANYAVIATTENWNSNTGILVHNQTASDFVLVVINGARQAQKGKFSFVAIQT